MSTFSCCPASNYLFTEYGAFCDQPPQNGDCDNCGPRGQDCILCYPCFTPFAFTYDLLSFPYRAVKHYCCFKISVET